MELGGLVAPMSCTTQVFVVDGGATGFPLIRVPTDERNAAETLLAMQLITCFAVATYTRWMVGVG